MSNNNNNFNSKPFLWLRGLPYDFWWWLWRLTVRPERQKSALELEETSQIGSLRNAIEAHAPSLKNSIPNWGVHVARNPQGTANINSTVGKTCLARALLRTSPGWKLRMCLGCTCWSNPACDTGLAIGTAVQGDEQGT